VEGFDNESSAFCWHLCWPLSEYVVKLYTCTRETRRERRIPVVRLRKFLTSLILTLVGLFSSSCMTMEHLLDREQKLQVYGGTKSSYNYIENPGSPRFGVLLRIIDLPFTVLADTLITPVTIPLAD